MGDSWKEGGGSARVNSAYIKSPNSMHPSPSHQVPAGVATCHSLRMASTAASAGSTPTATSAVAVKSALSPAMRAFFSGAVAGVVADSVLHPLDTINLRMKIQHEQSRKYSGLFKAMRTILREGRTAMHLMCQWQCDL